MRVSASGDEPGDVRQAAGNRDAIAIQMHEAVAKNAVCCDAARHAIEGARIACALGRNIRHDCHNTLQALRAWRSVRDSEQREAR